MGNYEKIVPFLHDPAFANSVAEYLDGMSKNNFTNSYYTKQGGWFTESTIQSCIYAKLQQILIQENLADKILLMAEVPYPQLGIIKQRSDILIVDEDDAQIVIEIKVDFYYDSANEDITKLLEAYAEIDNIKQVVQFFCASKDAVQRWEENLNRAVGGGNKGVFAKGIWRKQ